MDKDQRLVNLGKRVKYLRTDRGLTQVDLASRVNKDQQSIQRFEAGRINPSYLYLWDIAKGLDITLSDLVDGI